jgi:hypothetical protein
MPLHYVCWLLWIGGTALIVLSWADAVPNTVGWLGFAIACGGSFLPNFLGRRDPSQQPLTSEGFPVRSSGMPLPADMVLESGTPVLAYSRGNWWRATVINLEEDGTAWVAFAGWDPSVMDRLPRSSLQIDPDPTRQPLKLPPPGALDRLGGKTTPDRVQPSESKEGLHDQAADPSW